VRASAGFFPGSDPVVSEEIRDAMAEALDLRSDTVVEGANHYTMLWPEYIPRWAEVLRDDSWCR
jgi:lipase